MAVRPCGQDKIARWGAGTLSTGEPPGILSKLVKEIKNGILRIMTMLRCFRPAASVMMMSTVLIWGGHRGAIAAPAETAPPLLTNALTEIERAANGQDLAGVMGFYSAGFQHADGFNRSEYEAALSQLWSTYTTLTYDVELLSWEASGSALIAETLTTITGTQRQLGRDLTLTATVQSRQRFENGQITSQEILAEQARLVSGSNPPTVTLQLPEQVALGASFGFDAIVKEPLGDRILLGRALDEGVTAEDFLKPRPLSLNELLAGGLFKIGQAPDAPDQRWISSVIVREDGLVIDTRRLRVGN
jgi:hypothetical protein